jgi:hypothetical protein
MIIVICSSTYLRITHTFQHSTTVYHVVEEREERERERERKKEKKKEEWAVFLRIVQNIKKAE